MRNLKSRLGKVKTCIAAVVAAIEHASRLDMLRARISSARLDCSTGGGGDDAHDDIRNVRRRVGVNRSDAR
ncbi:MAG TPA: hypothetical protein VHE78_16705 [Gemmatimonadaceae bacterium]|nr:hypothetical protein [Gemmatimonadaceae bacterium]